jgi:hypothetical protein
MRPFLLHAPRGKKGLCVGALLVALWGCGGNVVVDPGSGVANGGRGNTSGVGASNSGVGGASGNLCTELANAFIAASQGQGCSALAAEAMAFEQQASNCANAPIDQKFLNCYLACLGKLTSCVEATQLTAFADCIGGCSP